MIESLLYSNGCIAETFLVRLDEIDWHVTLDVPILFAPYVKFSCPPIVPGAFHNYLSYNLLFM